MISKNVYYSIFLIGSVFALLTYIYDPDYIYPAITVEYLTIGFLLTIKLFQEWDYYRSYSAPPASAIFVTLLSILTITGSFIAGYATLGTSGPLQMNLVFFELNFGFLSLMMYLNTFGALFVLPFAITLAILLRRYISNYYRGIFIFRKQYPQKFVVIYSIILIIGYLIYWLREQIIELSVFILISALCIFFIQYYVLQPVVLVPRQRTQQFRRSRSRSQRPSRSSSERSTPVRSAATNTYSHPAPAPRHEPARSSTANSSTQAPTHIEIAPAINDSRGESKQRTQHLSVGSLPPETWKRLLPLGQNINEDDFRCIFCYAYPTESNRRVVICPHCHYPAHLDEFQKWVAVSKICSRCNKPVTEGKMIRMTGKNYQKLITGYKKRQKS